jgi:phosphate-selective porin OprO/OprP
MLRFSLALVLLAISGPAVAEDFNIELRGRLFVDFAAFEEDFASLQDSRDDNQFRAARLGVQGGWDDFSFVAELDFGGDKISVKDFRLRWSGEQFNVTVGHQKTPNSIEYITSSTVMTFQERAQPAQAFRYDRRVGVLVSRGGDNYSLAAGVFGGAISDDSRDFDITDSSVVAARATYAPVNEDGRVVHVGIHGRLYNRDSAEPESVRFRARPGTALANRYVDQRTAADSSTLVGLEGLIIQGPFHLMAEIAAEDADGAADATSWAVMGGIMLTGESRVYRASDGVLRAVTPSAPVSAGGLGAFELVGRIDQLDTDLAGRQTTYTAGLNWLVERNVRVMLNVFSADVSGPARFGEGDFQGAQIRFQVNWP